jgi:hypothetical protein
MKIIFWAFSGKTEKHEVNKAIINKLNNNIRVIIFTATI